MKLHLPVKLFRALMALSLISPFTSYAGGIPADYTLQWGDSVETIMSQSESAEDIAFILNTDLSFSGDSPVASGESGSRLFIDKANDDIAQKLSFSGFTSKLFDLDSNLAFTDLNTLTIRNNHQNTDERYASASVNASSISIDNVQYVDISSNVLSSVEGSGGYGRGAALNGDVQFRHCGDVNLSENHIEIGRWDNHSSGLNGITGAAIDGHSCFENNSDITIKYNSVYAHGTSGNIYAGAINGDTAFINNRDIAFEYNRISLNVYSSWYSYADGGAINASNEDIIFEKNRNISFVGCSASAYVNYGTAVYAQGGAICTPYQGAVIFKNNGDVNFDDNYVYSRGTAHTYANGGVVYGDMSLFNNGDIAIRNNSSSSYCTGNFYHGASSGVVHGGLNLSGNGNVIISGNKAESSGIGVGISCGGVVVGSLQLYNNQDVCVSSNYVSGYGYEKDSRGGAVDGEVYISGNHNVVFEKNYERHDSWIDEEETQTKSEFLLRSIYADCTSSAISATTGYSVTFYDTIYFGYSGWGSTESILRINADYTDINGNTQISGGDVIFSGAKTEEHLKEIINLGNYSEEELIPTEEQIAASRRSQVNGNLQVEGGRLLITDKAVLSVSGTTTVRNGATLTVSGAQFEGDIILSDDSYLELYFSEANTEFPLINGSFVWKSADSFDEDFPYGDYVEPGADALKIRVADVDVPDGQYLIADGWVYDYVRTVWSGANGSSWDSYNQNWTEGGEASYYEDGAPTIFEDQGAGAVYINEELQPEFVLVKNSEGYDYTWEDTGYGLSGKMSLTKRGDGTLTINNANTYSGNTYVEGGTLIVANENALGTGGVYLKDAKLQLNASLPNKLTTSGKSYLWVEGWDVKLQSTITNNGELDIDGYNCIDVSALELNKKASYRINDNGQIVANSESGYQVTGGYEVTVVEGNPLGITDESGYTYWYDKGMIYHDDCTYRDEYNGSYQREQMTLCQDGVARAGGKVDYSTYYLMGENDSFSVQEKGKKVVMDSGSLWVYTDAEVRSTGGWISAGSTWLSDTISLTGSIEDSSISTSSVHLTLDATLSGSTSLYISSNGDVTINGDNTYTGGTDIYNATVLINNANALGVGSVYVGNGGKLYTNGYDIQNNITTSGGTVIGSIRLNGDKALTVGPEGMTLDGGLTIDGGIININGGVLEVNELLNIEDGAPAQVNVSYHYLLDAEDDVVLMQFNGPIKGNTADAFSYTGGGVLNFDEESGTVSLTLGCKQIWVGGKKDSWMNGSAIGWSDAQPFVAGNRVVFNSAGTVTISGEVAPASVLVDVDKAFSFKNTYDKKTCTWSGYIGGNTGVFKRGTGALTLNDGNTYTGGTYIEAGTVNAGGAGAFGSGAIAISGGSLDLKSKAVANDIALADSATIKGGKKYLGTYTQTGGELMKGSVLNIAESATLSGGVVNGTLSGVGTVTIDGDVELGLTGKITADKLLVDGSLSASTKGLVMNSKTSAIEINGGMLTSQGKVSAASLKLNGGSLSLSGALSVKDLTLGSGTLTLNGAKLATVKVGNSLTLEGGTTLNLGFSVTEKDVAKGKSYKVFTFKTIDTDITDAELNDLLGLGTDAATLTFDSKRKAITLTVTDAEAWNEYAESVRNGTWTATPSEDDELVESAGAFVLARPAAGIDPMLGKVADTLVQSTWGTAGASRAFGDTIAARGTHATEFASGKGTAWISTMGGSSRISSDGAHAGADYTLTGASFGMEARLSEKSTIGMAIGNSWGKVSTFSAYPVDQDSTHQGIYGKHILGSTTTLSWMAAHTRTESDANLAGMPCDWTQDALQLDARVDKLFAVSDRTTVSAFVGMQYLATDKGECNGLSTGSLQNLRGEIGVSAAHKATDKTYVYGELSFVGDMVRNNPTATVGDYRSRGANPGRAGLNLSVGASYQLNDSWSLNGSYSLELMQNQTSHSANVGATYSF